MTTKYMADKKDFFSMLNENKLKGPTEAPF